MDQVRHADDPEEELRCASHSAARATPPFSDTLRGRRLQPKMEIRVYEEDTAPRAVGLCARPLKPSEGLVERADALGGVG